MPRRTLLTALCAGWLTLIGALANAFVVEGPRDGARDGLDNLLRAPRWNAGSDSLLETGDRSLGGGLEYAIDDSICTLNFIDGASCADAREALARAMDRWALGHPALSFTDVSKQVRPGVPYGRGPSRQGAEIDFFADTGQTFPPFRNAVLTGYTIFYERPATGLELTNGSVLAVAIGRIESADVRFNAGRCFYIDPDRGRPECVHFPSAALHEIGHALGLGHPDDRIHFNLDTNADPRDPIAIDCRDPMSGLRVSTAIEGAAVLVGQDVQGPGRWRRGLLYDDIAARDALYPHCGIISFDRRFRAWGAYAQARDGQRVGRGRGAASPAEAERAALSACGPDCEISAVFDGCFAFASDGRVTGQAKAVRSNEARANAVLDCAANGGQSCAVIDHFCAFE